ncbi:DNA circularization N-terminal domain-containing protein [Pendulispora brunnea]|uniref:DNA circularization N-terminal domain-containing protein n=1 Tax=Pendulispora brunnea TaxID=2905690 RepID=A0ABZ2KKK6_9BACT
MSASDKLPPASFAGIRYPLESQKIRGGVRHHVHEYPHAAGGAPEKLGRSLYRVSQTAVFLDTFRRYPKLYPYDLDRLRVLFEAQKTDVLVVPGLGPVDAFCISWERDLSAHNRSGERVTFEYIEDQSADFVVEAFTDLSPRSMDTHAAKLARELAMVKADLAARDARNNTGFLAKLQNTLNRIQDTVGRIAAVGDQVGMYGNLLEAELARLTNLCHTFDRVEVLHAPIYFRLLDALHDLWAASIGRTRDLLNTRGRLQTWTVPVTMAIQQASVGIFGDATHTGDLMTLNVISDPFRIAAGTKLRYYPAT